MCINRAGASTCDCPTHAKNSATIHNTRMKSMLLNGNWLPCNCPSLKTTDDKDRNRTNGNGRSNDQIHIGTLKEKHIVDLEPRNNLRFGQNNTKIGTY